MMRDLMRHLLCTLVLLELVRQLVLLELVRQLVLLEFVRQLRLLEFMRQLVLLEFMRQLVLLQFVRQLFLAERLAGDPAENGAERTTDRRAHHGGSDSRDRLEKRCRTPYEAADAAKGSTEELLAFELAGELVLLELVLFPLVLCAFVLLELAEAFQLPFEFQFQFAFICGRHDDSSSTWRCLMSACPRLGRRASRIFQEAAAR